MEVQHKMKPCSYTETKQNKLPPFTERHTHNPHMKFGIAFAAMLPETVHVHT